MFNENRIELDVYKVFIPLEFSNSKLKIENNINKLSYKEDNYSYIKIGIPKDEHLKYLFILYENKLTSFEKLIIYDEDFKSKNIRYLGNSYFESVIDKFRYIILNEYENLRSQYYKINDTYINPELIRLKSFIRKNLEFLHFDTVPNENYNIIFYKLVIYIKNDEYNIEKLNKFKDIIPIKYADFKEYSIPYIVLYIYNINTLISFTNECESIEDIYEAENKISSKDEFLNILNKVIIDDYIKSKSNIISGNYDDEDIYLVVFREATFGDIDPTDIESENILKMY